MISSRVIETEGLKIEQHLRHRGRHNRNPAHQKGLRTLGQRLSRKNLFASRNRLLPAQSQPIPIVGGAVCRQRSLLQSAVTVGNSYNPLARHLCWSRARWSPASDRSQSSRRTAAPVVDPQQRVCHRDGCCRTGLKPTQFLPAKSVCISVVAIILKWFAGASLAVALTKQKRIVNTMN